MELIKGYKQTDIGVIPEDWQVKLLVNIGEIATGTTPPTNNLNNYGEDYFFVSPADLGKGKYIIDTEKKLSKLGFSISRKYPANSILFTCIGSTIGKSGISTRELSSNQQINSVFPNDSFSSDFLYYYLNFISPKIKLGASEQAVPMINKTEFGKTIVAFPTKTEQVAIANVLSDIDSLIDRLEKLIVKKRMIKQGAMQKLMTPKDGWEVKKLGEIANIIMGQSPLSEYYNSEGIGLPLVQGNADIANRKTIIRFFTSAITKRGKVGDIIMSVRAPVGEISKATFECCLGRGVCAISYDNDFLYHYLIYFEKSWAKLSTGSTFDSVNSKQVKELGIPIPSTTEEQINIATILSNMDNEIEALEVQLEKNRKIKLGMMQNLLTGKIRLV